MAKKTGSSKRKQVSQAASLLGKRGVAARKAKWGEQEFRRQLQERGKLGGRPRKVKPPTRQGKTK